MSDGKQPDLSGVPLFAPRANAPSSGPQPVDPRERVLEVEVDDVSYQSADGRFVVARVSSRKGSESITAVGDLGAVTAAEHLQLRGRFEEHPKYGTRFRVTSFVPIVPDTTLGIARYLGSGLIEGIGPALAKRLVGKFGKETITVISTESGRLREVSGIGLKRAEAIAEAVRSRRDEAESMGFLHSLGLGPATARRILKKYGPRTVQVVHDDPYLVAEQVKGIGFRTADQIGRNAGIETSDPRRTAGALLHLLNRAVDEGHVFLPRDELLKRARALSVESTHCEAVLPVIEERGIVVREDDAYYRPELFEAETRIARDLAQRARLKPKTRRTATRVEDSRGLSEEQSQAVERSFDSALMVLTGGPGTGKTTTVKAIVAAHIREGRRVLLAAPTGRAAKRLSEAAEFPASTIHRLLEWNAHTGQFRRNEDEPVEADLLLIDEASMLELRLADSLLRATAHDCHILFVGDVDQLPPIGPGQVLRDLIDSSIAPTVRLTEVFRQAQKSAIVRGAHAIRTGNLPQDAPKKSAGEARADGDLFVIKSDDSSAILDRLLRLMDRMQVAYGLEPKRDVQVLSPMRKGPLGILNLNELLQSKLNPGAPLRFGFRCGDRVMQLRNDYDRDVYNGDLGEVLAISNTQATVSIDGRAVIYTRGQLDDLALAYASTIHKVQGSEFPAIILVLHTSHYVLLSRPLIYTGLTRAKHLAVILGAPRAIKRAIDNNDSSVCFSRLRKRLEDASA